MEAPIRTFEDLECWKACREMRAFVAKTVCKTLPKDERYRLADQILRAARSTTANIAEGYGRFHFLDNAKFCSNSRGSCQETLDHLITAYDEEMISDELLADGRALVARSIALLNGYISYLQKAHQAKGTAQEPNNK
ncbi:MAG: four helix bundle protein [Verrucomicrobiota bacterium]